MIDAKTLMIGNYVNDRDSVARIDAFTSSSAWIEYLEYEEDRSRVLEMPLESLSYIPLTEQWLLEFGFDKDTFDEDTVFSKDEIKIFIWYFTEKEHNGFYFQTYSLEIKIEFVNQIQNLYFALKGHHLTLKK